MTASRPSSSAGSGCGQRAKVVAPNWSLPRTAASIPISRSSPSFSAAAAAERVVRGRQE